MLAYDVQGCEPSQLEELGGCMDLCLAALHKLTRIQAQGPLLVGPRHLRSWMESIDYIARGFAIAEASSQCLGHASPSTALSKVLASLAEVLAVALEHMAAMGPLLARLPPASLQPEEAADGPSWELCTRTVQHLCILSGSQQLHTALQVAPPDARACALSSCKLLSAATSILTALVQYEPEESPLSQSEMQMLAGVASPSSPDGEPAWDCTWLTRWLATDPSLKR